MNPQAEHAAAAVDRITRELLNLVERARQSGDVELFFEEFERWKRRAVTTLREQVSSDEAARFGRLSTRPNWVTMESPDEPIERHMRYLQALPQRSRSIPMRLRYVQP
jgi:hypothetical protein